MSQEIVIPLISAASHKIAPSHGSVYASLVFELEISQAGKDQKVKKVKS
jgi:hypothetical protein